VEEWIMSVPAIRSALAAAEKRGIRRTVASFTFCMAALIAGVVVMRSRFTDVGGFGVYLWSMVVLGAAIIAGVLAAILIPNLREVRHSGRR
jgi:Fe2+ transport system protein B